MSLSIATSNLVKSSASKPESVNSGQSHAVSEQGDGGEQKLFSDTLDATLGEAKNSKVAKGAESETAKVDADTVDAESELKGQVSAQSFLNEDSDEVEVDSEDLDVKKMAPEGEKAVVDDGIADLDKSSHKTVNQAVNQEGDKQQPQMPSAASQTESGKQVADKTVSESAELLARLDESNKALKAKPVALSVQQSDELKVAAVSGQQQPSSTKFTNLNTDQATSSEDAIEQSVTKLTPVEGAIAVTGKTQAQTISTESAAVSDSLVLESDGAKAVISSNQNNTTQQIAAVAEDSEHLSDTETSAQPSVVNASQTTVVSDDITGSVTGDEAEVAMSKQDVPQHEKTTTGSTTAVEVQGMGAQAVTDNTDEQALEVAVKQEKQAIQWKTQSEPEMHQELTEQQSQQSQVMPTQPQASETLATEQTQPNALQQTAVTDEKVDATVKATTASLDASGAIASSNIDGSTVTDSEQVLSVQSGPATKPSSELQWSTSEIKVELTDSQNTKAAKPLLSAAAVTAALNNTSQATNNTSPMTSAETSAATNASLGTTSVEGKLIHQSAQLAELSASASTAASSSLAQSASLATTAAAIGANSRKQASNEVSDINAATGTASSATQLNMVRAEQAQQAATPQSPLLLNKENAAEQMSERLQMMMSKNLKHVDIRLDPPELGRMQIRMTLNSDSASVHFTVQNQQTRDMVDQAMPRLREMLSQQGITLADTSVQQQNSGQQRDAQQMAQGTGQGSGSRTSGQEDAEVMADEATTVNVAMRNPSDGISYYA